MFNNTPQVQSTPVEFTEVDNLMSRAVASGNPLLVTDHLNTLQTQAITKSVASAKALYMLRENWSYFQAAGASEEWDVFASANVVNLVPENARKYANMWESVFEKSTIDAILKGQLAQVPIKNLLLLTAAVREGSLTDEQIANIPMQDYDTIHEAVRGARGDATSSKNRITGVLVVKEGGSLPRGALYAVRNGERETIGYLNLDVETEFGQMFLERMKNALKLMENG